MRISEQGIITGAFGTQELWIWEPNAPAPISLGIRGYDAQFLDDRLVAVAPASAGAGNPSGIIQWPGSSPAVTNPSVIDTREPTRLFAAGDWWLANHGSTYFGSLPDGNIDGGTAGPGQIRRVRAIQADGTYVLGYASGTTPSEIVRRVGPRQKIPRDTGVTCTIRDGLVFCHDVDADHVVLYDESGERQVSRLAGVTIPLLALNINKIPWICYMHRSVGAWRTVLHPFDDASRGVIVDTRFVYGLDIRLVRNQLYLAWALDESEAYNDDDYYHHIVREVLDFSDLRKDALSERTGAPVVGAVQQTTTLSGGGSSVVDADGSKGWSGETPTIPTIPTSTGERGSVPPPLDIDDPTTRRVFRVSTNDPAISAGAGTISELPPSYNPTYPHNNLLAASESGHLVEVDDTPGAERIHVFHRSGSHIEMRPDGSVKYKTTKLRQDVTIGDHEVIIQGDWRVTVDGGMKLLVRNGALEIEANDGAAINVKGQLKLAADNILLRAQKKISLDAPNVDLGPSKMPFMSLPGGIASLFGVPLPIVTSMALPAFPFNPMNILGSVSGGIQTFAKIGKLGASALGATKMELMPDPITGEPMFPEIDQPREIPLSAPAVYAGRTPVLQRHRDRLFDTPEDADNIEAYTAHATLMEELGDFTEGGIGKTLPGQVYTIDETPPTPAPTTPRAFAIGDGTVTLESGNTTVVGSATNFLEDYAVGQRIVIDDTALTIAGIQDETTLYLEQPWTQANTSGATIYTVGFRPFSEFAQRHEYHEDDRLGQSGLLLRDVMPNFYRPVVEVVGVQPIEPPEAILSGLGTSTPSKWVPLPGITTKVEDEIFPEGTPQPGRNLPAIFNEPESVEIKSFPGGWYADALPSGEYVVLYMEHLITHLGRIDFAQGTSDQPYMFRPLFPVITNIGGFRIAGQSHFSDKVVEYIGHTQSWRIIPVLSSGVCPVIYDLRGRLHIVDAAANSGGVGSQGYRYVDIDTGQLVTGGATYSPTSFIRLYGWTYLGFGIFVGQGPTGGVHIYDGKNYRLLGAGNTQFIRAHRQDNTISVAWWRLDGPSVVMRFTIAMIPTFPVVNT